MRPHRGRLATIVVLSLCGVVVGCSSTSEYVPIPVEDARAIRTHVSAFYTGTVELIEDSSGKVEQLGVLPDSIRAEDFEIQLVKTALMACLNEGIEIVEVSTEPPRGVTARVGSDPYQPLTQRDILGNVAHCSPADMIALESYIEHAPARIKAFVTAQVLDVDALRVNLKHVAQERLNLLEEYALDARTDAVRLREDSRLSYEQVTGGSGDYTQEQRLQTEADYETIQQELDEIEGLVDTVNAELPDLRRYRRQLVEDVAQRLATMGLPDS